MASHIAKRPMANNVSCIGAHQAISVCRLFVPVPPSASLWFCRLAGAEKALVAQSLWLADAFLFTPFFPLQCSHRLSSLPPSRVGSEKENTTKAYPHTQYPPHDSPVVCALFSCAMPIGCWCF
nr:hypothetical protein [Pandoravirus massiliensis]